MTAVELKVQIEKELEKLPEQDLTEVLNYIKKVQAEKTTKNIERIINNNRELFQKLAQ